MPDTRNYFSVLRSSGDTDSSDSDSDEWTYSPEDLHEMRTDEERIGALWEMQKGCCAACHIPLSEPWLPCHVNVNEDTVDDCEDESLVENKEKAEVSDRDSSPRRRMRSLSLLPRPNVDTTSTILDRPPPPPGFGPGLYDGCLVMMDGKYYLVAGLALDLCRLACYRWARYHRLVSLLSKK